MEAMKGRAIIQINALLTVVFIVTSLVAVVVFDQPWKAIAVTVCLVCFSVGVVAFLWGIGQQCNAVGKTRFLLLLSIFL